MTRYLVPGGTGNWNSTTNWSATSGGASGASFPVAGDDVIIDANSANQNLNINVASACATLIASSYTGTLTFTNSLTMTSTLTYSAGMNTAGSGNLILNGSGVRTSNGVTHSGNLLFQGTTTTITFADNWIVSGNCNFANTGAGAALTINGSTLTINGSLTVQNNANRIVTGTTNLVLAGNSTWAGGTNSELRLNTTITGTYAPAGTTIVTYGTGNLVLSGGSLTIGTLNIRSSCSLDLNGATIGTLTNSLVATITLVSDINPTTISVLGNLTFNGTGTFSTANFIIGGVPVTRTVTLVAGQTYYITSSMSSSVGTSANVTTLNSSIGGVKANLVLTNPITQSNVYLDITDIDSSAGATGWVVNGTLSNTTNWKVLPTQPQTITSAFSN